MMRCPNPYANISLAPPEAPPANFGAPMNWMQMETPQMETPDTANQVSGLGQSLIGMKRQFGSKQQGAIGEALKGAKGMLG